MERGVRILVSLGSNRGDRRGNLVAGLNRLADSGFHCTRLSPVVESPAVLPPDSPSEWNYPYLNIVAQGETLHGSEDFYKICKSIQSEAGRGGESKWAPRDLDIDIILWGDSEIAINGKTIPTPDMFFRPFVVSPMVHIDPSLKFPFGNQSSVFQLSSSDALEFHIPLWMGILNVTPDSFSDGGKHVALKDIDTAVQIMIDSGANIIDIGAESTRPNARALDASEEWERLEAPLKLVLEKIDSGPLKPLVSVDTYHPETAEKALAMGVEIINDVSGLTSDSMMGLARESEAQFVAMHSVTVPVQPEAGLPPGANAVAVVKEWILSRQRIWDAHRLDLNRIIVDPGIGFGKSSLQSLDLMRAVKQLRALGQRVLIGHSRKRFMRSFSKYDSAELDTETIGASLNLCAQGVDILRVHDINGHKRAYLSWLHLMQNRD